jgi:hypothetical protein
MQLVLSSSSRRQCINQLMLQQHICAENIGHISSSSSRSGNLTTTGLGRKVKIQQQRKAPRYSGLLRSRVAALIKATEAVSAIQY